MNRELRFRAWHNGKMFYWGLFRNDDTFLLDEGVTIDEENDPIMEFTGLKDKNGLTDIYEGDILGLDGLVKGNIYETSYEPRFDLVIASMGTKAWRDTEQTAMARGCKYTS